MSGYAWPWNVLGWPGVNVPAGLVGDGLPVGAQLLGPAHSEPLLISLAAQLEADQRWFERRPPCLRLRAFRRRAVREPPPHGGVLEVQRPRHRVPHPVRARCGEVGGGAAERLVPGGVAGLPCLVREVRGPGAGVEDVGRPDLRRAQRLGVLPGDVVGAVLAADHPVPAP
ncbi:hypothetical protein [Streptomyces sp. KL116D]|uniref:hypothetical protein n=1 Tax=Streptomyces sp. KL116D TaxID=3045152 RepID=UPI003556D027